MQPTKINILRCIFILRFYFSLSRAEERENSFVLYKFYPDFNKNGNRPKDNAVNRFKSITQLDDTRLKHIIPREARSSDVVKEFENKILIKRIVPHGYGETGNLYDEKLHTLYKPLARVPIITPKEYNELNKKLPGEVKNAIDTFLILDDTAKSPIDILKARTSELNEHDSQNYSPHDIIDLIGKIAPDSHKKENSKMKKGNSNVGILNLSFSPTGHIQAKERRSKNKNIFEDKQGSVDKGRRSVYGSLKRNVKHMLDFKNKQKNKTSNIRKRKPYFGHKLNDLNHFRFNVPSSNDQITLIDTIKNGIRNLINGDPIAYHGNSEPSVKRTAGKITGDNKHSLARFIPVGKHSMGDKLRGGKKILENQFGSNKLSSKGKPSDIGYRKLRTFHKSFEELDPLTPKELYFNYEGSTTTTTIEPWRPYYPYWNYWTYDKTLHEDECKAGLVKVGELCIALPPGS